MAGRTVPVTLPDRVWGRLASVAETNGVKVGDLIAAAILRELETPAQRPRHVPEVLAASNDPLADVMHEIREARDAGWRAPRGKGKYS